MPRHKYSGCILRKPVDAYSYKGDYRNIGGKTAQQNIEISQEHVEKLIKRNHLVPICTEHDTIKIGEVVNTYQKQDGSVWVDFELDDTSTAGNTAHQLVKGGLINHLSWNHDWNDLQPIEVSLTFKPGRDGTNIERPPQHNNSQEYIQPQVAEGVNHQTPCMMSANAESVSSGSAAAAAPAEQATQAPVATTPAATAADATTPAFEALTKQYPGLANLPEHHKLNLKHIISNNMLSNEQRGEMIDSVLNSIKAEQEKEALLKEKENELRKLKEENSTLSKDRQQGRQQFHTLVENLVKAHAPHLITEEFSNNGKQYIAEDTNKWIDHLQPAMMACNMELLNQKSKQQEVWMEKVAAISKFVGGEQSAPAMVQANYHKSVGSKRSAEEMMTSNNNNTSAASASSTSFMDRIPMSAESRSLFAKWGSLDAGMDIRPTDIGFGARHLAVKEQV